MSCDCPDVTAFFKGAHAFPQQTTACQQYDSSMELVILFVILLYSRHCFGVRGIVSVVCFIALSKGIEPLM